MKNLAKSTQVFQKGHFLLLVLSPILLLSHALFSEKLFYYRDFWQIVYPNLKWGIGTITSGSFPLWNPNIATGYPIFSSMLHGFAYPPLYFFLLLFPFDLGLKLYILFHFFWAGFGMYLLCRHWQLKPLPATFASLIFMLGGPLVSGVNNLAYLITPAWIPWAILCYSKSYQNTRFIGLTAIVMALMALSGEAQTCYNTGILFFFFSLSKLEKGKLGSGVKLLGGKLFLIVLLALLLAAIQIIPSLELGRNSERLSGTNENDAILFSLYGEDLPRLFIPFIYGNPPDIWYGRIQHHHTPFETSIYIGLLPLILGVIGCFSWQEKRLRFFLLFSFLFFFLNSFGAELPFYTFLRNIHIPLWSSFRYSEKLILPAFFLFSILAAFGMETLIEQSKKRILLCFLGSVLFYLSLFSYFFFLFPSFNVPNAEIMAANESYRQGQFFAAGVFSFLTLFSFYLFYRFSSRPNLVYSFCCIILASELIYYQQQIIPTVEKSFYQECPKILAPLSKNEQYRASVLGSAQLPAYRGFPTLIFDKAYRDYGVANLPENFQIMKDWGIVPTMIDKYAKIRETALNLFRRNPQAGYHNRLLERLAVKRVIWKIYDPIIPQEQQKNLFYDIPNPRQRCSLIFETKQATSRKEALKLMATLPSTTAILLNPEKTFPKITPSKEATGQLRIVPTNSSNKLQIEVETNSPAYLLVSDAYYPGWKAFINEEPTEIFIADLAFRLIYVPAGKHQVVFIYRPYSFYFGFILSLLSWLGMFGYLKTKNKAKSK